MSRYDPEETLNELRAARDHGDKANREMFRIMNAAAGRAATELWPDPHAREAAGIGAVVAAATLSFVADTAMLTAVGFFGLALVENARSQTETTR